MLQHAADDANSGISRALAELGYSIVLDLTCVTMPFGWCGGNKSVRTSSTNLGPLQPAGRVAESVQTTPESAQGPETSRQNLVRVKSFVSPRSAISNAATKSLALYKADVMVCRTV